MIKLPRIRWLMIGLCSLALAISYIDRTNIAIAAPHIKADLGLNDGEMGLILGAFFWSYSLMQIPAGWIMDRVGTRAGMAFAVGWWSLFTMLTAIPRSIAPMIGFRLMLGAGEAASNPGCTKVVHAWFPKSQRGLASGIFDAGPQLGTAIALPLTAMLIAAWGWRMSFFVSGFLGLVWAVGWLTIYRDPARYKHIAPDQLEFYKQERAASDQGYKVPWLSLFKYRSIWAMMIGFFCLNFVKYFFITWFPTYLIQAKHFSLGQLGSLGAVPALMSLPGSALGGWLTDELYRRGFSLTRARKTCLVGGMLVSSVIALAAFTSSVPLTLMLFSITYAALGCTAAVIWTLPTDIAPAANYVASIGGIQNFAANLAGVVTSSATGLMLTASGGSFLGPLILAGAVCIVGALTYLFLLGKIEPIGRPPRDGDRPHSTPELAPLESPARAHHREPWSSPIKSANYPARC